MQRCEECGFIYDTDGADQSAAAIVGLADQLATRVSAPRADVRTRPAPTTWSPLEYACHVRDVLLVQRERVLLARRHSRPDLAPMGRDERAAHDGYNDQAVDDVCRQLRDAAAMFANVLTRLARDDWSRTVIYSYPAPAERTLQWVTVHTEHELRHHLGDVAAEIADLDEGS